MLIGQKLFKGVQPPPTIFPLSTQLGYSKPKEFWNNRQQERKEREREREKGQQNNPECQISKTFEKARQVLTAV